MKISEFCAREQKILYLNDWSKKIAPKTHIADFLFKNILKISNFEKSAKTLKNQKQQKKFCVGAFTL